MNLKTILATIALLAVPIVGFTAAGVLGDCCQDHNSDCCDRAHKDGGAQSGAGET